MTCGKRLAKLMPFLVSSQLHTSEAIGVPLKVCKCVVKLYRADPFRLPKIVFGSLQGFPPDRTHEERRRRLARFVDRTRLVVRHQCEQERYLIR
jgi:hypothetical protein